MAAIYGQTVVFSAPCADGAYSPGGEVPMLVEVSKVTIVPVPISLEDLEYAKSIIDNSKDVMDSAIDVAKTLLDDKKADKVLDVFVGLGDIVKGILKVIPKAENPLIKNLEALENRVKKLEDQVIDHFDAMKMFMTTVQFFRNIISPTSVLIKHMRDCIKHPGDKAVKNFENAYHQHSPLNLAYTLISYLEQKSTNPLCVAMANEKLRTKETYKLWEDIISRVLGQFVLLQAFANGLLKFEKKFNCNLLVESSNQVLRTLSDWKEEFKLEDFYWNGFKKFLENDMFESRLNNAGKADEIKKKLETYLTNDSFYIFVFDEAQALSSTTFFCTNQKSQMAECWDKKSGKISAVVYRSRHAHNKSDEDYEKIKREVESCRNGKINYKAIRWERVLEESLLDTNIMPRYGFIFIVDKNKKPEVRSANCPGREWGPGWWITAEASIMKTGEKWEVCLAASFE